MDEFDMSISIVSYKSISKIIALIVSIEIGICECNFRLFYSQIKNISSATSIPNIVECKKGIQQYSDRIDKIQLMLDRINADITTLEQNVTKAEEDLGYNKTGIKGFFKPLLGKIVNKNERSRPESVETTPTYQPSELFKSADYFGELNSSLTDTEAEGTSKGS